MCIKDYQNMLMEITDKILNNKFKHPNTIIVGDNSSGKSEILKSLFSKQNKGYYFIDSVNRGFNYENISSSEDLKESYKNVVKNRINEKNFNLIDTFDLYEDGLGSIERIYLNYKEELKSIVKEFLNINFEIKNEDNPILGKRKVLKIDGEIEKLSSGYQAIIRLFLELIYFKNSVEDNIKNMILVIDEINEFLSTKNEERILSFIMKKFSNMNFIVTTHSVDVIASSIDCNIVVLSEHGYECLDGNDFSSVTDAREIYEKIYNLYDENENNDIEIKLRNLLNSKISDTWTEVEENELNKIKEEDLTNVQMLILSQIKSW